MCNFSPAGRNGCLLLTHGQVVTLFHGKVTYLSALFQPMKQTSTNLIVAAALELGHCMHDLVARTKYAKFHGYEVCLEFGEGIATMLENWCWMKDELMAISTHYTYTDQKYMEAWVKENPGRCPPPTDIPDAMVDDIVRARRDDRVDLHLAQL